MDGKKWCEQDKKNFAAVWKTPRPKLWGEFSRGENSVRSTITTKPFLKFLIVPYSIRHFCFKNVRILPNICPKTRFQARIEGTDNFLRSKKIT